MKFGPFTTLGFLFTIPLSAVAQENQIGEKTYMQEDVGLIGFDKATFDFGEVAQGETIQHTFLFINNGTLPIEIERAYARTPGVSVLASHEPVEPESIGELKVSFNTSYSEGPQTVRVHVESTAYNAPSTLYLKANILAEEAEKDAEAEGDAEAVEAVPETVVEPETSEVVDPEPMPEPEQIVPVTTGEPEA